MRIALLTHEPFYPPSGGGSAAAVYLVREMTRRGYSVEVFGPALPDPETIEQQLGIQLRPFTAWRMGRTTPWRTLKYLAYPFALERVFRRVAASGNAYDILVAQHSISAVTAGRLRRRLGIPTVLNLLDCLTGFLETWPSWFMPRSAARALLRFELALPTWGSADGVLTVSDALKRRIVDAGFPAERTQAAYYGFDARLFRRTQPTPASDQHGVVVMHGSFDRHHLGHIARETLIEVLRRRPNVRIRFVGPVTPVLGRFAHDLRHRVPAALLDLTGFTPYEKIPERLADATVGITPYEPSTGTHCAFVAKTVEYLALGLPVVSTPLESALAYYRGLDAVSFSGPDGEGFADAIVRWMDTPADQRSAIVEPARRKVEAELDWEVLTRRAVDFIEATAQRSALAKPRVNPGMR